MLAENEKVKRPLLYYEMNLPVHKILILYHNSYNWITMERTKIAE